MKGKMKQFLCNKSNFRVVQNASLNNIFEKVYSESPALSEIHSTFSEKPLCLAAIYQRLKMASKNAPSKSLQRHMRLDVSDEWMEIVSQSPYRTSKNPS